MQSAIVFTVLLALAAAAVLPQREYTPHAAIETVLLGFESVFFKLINFFFFSKNFRVEIERPKRTDPRQRVRRRQLRGRSGEGRTRFHRQLIRRRRQRGAPVQERLGQRQRVRQHDEHHPRPGHRQRGQRFRHVPDQHPRHGPEGNQQPKPHYVVGRRRGKCSLFFFVLYDSRGLKLRFFIRKKYEFESQKKNTELNNYLCRHARYCDV